jgi:beta-glucosidase
MPRNLQLQSRSDKETFTGGRRECSGTPSCFLQQSQTYTVRTTVTICLIATLAILCNQAMAQGSRFSRSAAEDASIDSVLALMTLDEKVGQLVQYSGGFETGPGGRALPEELRLQIREGKIGSLLNATGAAETRELQRIAVEESRLKIPLIFGLDVIHGYKTTFPIPLGEAATWDPQAVERSARIGAIEATAGGIHWTFGPMVDIARDPRWGRMAEGSGEDPYLGSLMAAARVRGFQGSSLSDPTTLVACPKHFAAYGAAEGGRDYNTVDLSERTLRDVYLPPFMAAADAGAGTFMASFNEIAGVPSSGNEYLMTEILKKEWQFDGFVVSDWGSIREMIPHGFASDPADAGRLAINAGVDMDMMGDCFGGKLQGLVKAGKVSQVRIDDAVRRILRVKYRLGLFKNPYRNVTVEREKAALLTPANIAACREVARKSLVLLRNNGGLLPLSKGLTRIAVIGPLANDRSDPLGPWAGPSDTMNVVTVLQGIRNAVPKADVQFSRGCGIQDDDLSGIEDAVRIAKGAEVAVIVAGEARGMSGEASCRSSIGLPGVQQELIKQVITTGTPVVLVLMNGRSLAISWEAEHVPAILEAWFPGLQSGNAIADVVFGDVAPSGRLPVTFPCTTGQVPLYYNFKNTGRPFNDTVEYTSRYLDVRSTPLFPFGFGLTYTTFTYDDLRVEKVTLGTSDTLHVAVQVHNTGNREGEEIVQLYVRDDVGSVTRPVKELKAFKHVVIKPHGAATVNLSVPIRELAFTALDMKTRVEPGTFHVFVGPNALEGLVGKFTVEAH